MSSAVNIKIRGLMRSVHLLKWIFLSLFLTPISAIAYPLAYTCDTQGKSVLNENPFQDIVASFSNQTNSLDIEQLSSRCQTELSQRYFLSTGKTIKAFGSGENPIERLAQCSEKIIHQSQLLSANRFVLFYPNKSNYMVAATGCNGRLTSCASKDFLSFKKVIEDAIIMQTDPYALLAVHLMENGDVGRLTLDPVAKVSVLGCTGKASNANDESALNSFGTFHTFQNKIVTNDTLASLLQNYLSKRNVNFESKQSFYCRNTNSAELIWSTEPQQNSCCLKLPFLALDSSALDSAFTVYFLKRLLSTPAAVDSPNKSEPEFRVQKFNGFTNLMGGAERVPAFRLGVNFYQTPAYGYQVMDYILNALLPSPDIRSMISQAESQYGSSVNHLLCIGKPVGNYQIDNSAYFDKHKNSVRLQLLADKYQQGLKISDLTQRELFVFTAELESDAVQEMLGRPMLTARKTLNDFYQSSGLVPKRANLAVSFADFKNISEIQADIAKIPTEILSEEEKISVNSYFSDLIVIGNLKQNISDNSQKIYQMPEYQNICTIFSALNLNCVESGAVYSLVYYKNWISHLTQNLNLVEKKNGVDSALRLQIQAVQQKLTELTEQAIKLSQLDNAAQNKAKKIRASLSPQLLSSWNYKESLSVNKAQSLQSYLDDLAIPKNREDLIAAAKVQYDGQIFLLKMNPSDYWDIYFTKVYNQRKTVGQASDYPWRPLLDEEVRTMRKLYNFE